VHCAFAARVEPAVRLDVGPLPRSPVPADLLAARGATRRRYIDEITPLG